MNLPVPVDPKDLDRLFRAPLPRYYNKPEVDAILSANAHDVRAYIIINSLWKTGLRCSELTGLERIDLDPYNKTLRVNTLKHGLRRRRYGGVGRPTKSLPTSKNAVRIVPIPDDLVAALTSWLHTFRGDAIFPFSRSTIYRIVKDACRRAGIRDGRAHPHTFRHSYAVHLLREGVPITVVKEILGHSNISNTLLYLRIIQPDKELILRQVKW